MKEPEKILEASTRFSKSLLWKLQEKAYTQFGPKAWSHKGVPFYLTSNPFTARQYAHVAAAYLRDCLSNNSKTPIDQAEPVYIFDLGAGTGRFGYLFLRLLLPMLGNSLFQDLKIRYVMTDIAQSNLDFLENHPYLQGFIREGLLEFAYFRHDQQNPIELKLSGKRVEFTTNPIIVIGNYFFDTIPQDLFLQKGGLLLEGRITLAAVKTKEIPDPQPEDPENIPNLTCHYDFFPIECPQDYYKGFPLINKLLKDYSLSFEGIPFTFPEGAFATVDYFARLSKNRLLLLAGDQGFATEEQVKTSPPLHIAKHGTFSISVSYHALALYFKEKGGIGLLTSQPNPIFVVIAAMLGGSKNDFVETDEAFRLYMDSFEPSDYLRLIVCSEQEWQNPSIEHMLLLLKLGNWDPMNFHAFFPSLLKQLPEASQTIKDKLQKAIHLVWDHFYPTSPQEGDFVQNLGVILFHLGKFKEAILFFERSLSITGEQASTLMNMGACYLALKDQENALKCQQRAKKCAS